MVTGVVIRPDDNRGSAVERMVSMAAKAEEG